MLTCFRKPTTPPPSPPAVSRPSSPQKVARILTRKGYELKNEQLDSRDEHMDIELSHQRCKNITQVTETVKREVSEWLVEVNFNITSRGFRHYVGNKLNQAESKNYTSKNILRNIKTFFESLKGLSLLDKKALMFHVNRTERNILTELLPKYPQSASMGASKRVRTILPIIDNRANDEYDFLLRHDITFTLRPDLDYAADVMRALNKMISVASQNVVWKSAQLDESYFELFSEFFEQIVTGRVQADKAKFLQEFDSIYHSKDGPAGQWEQKGTEKLNIKACPKIPISTLGFTEEEITSGQFKIQNSSILRVIAKWTYELEEKIKNPKEFILKRVEKFKLRSRKLISLENNQKFALYEAALAEKEKIQEYLEVLKDENVMLQTLFAEEMTEIDYANDDLNVEMFASRVRQVYSQCMFKYLCKIIHSLARIPRRASQLYLERHSEELPEDELKTNFEMLKEIDLISFKVGDLLRAKYNCIESQFIKIYRNLAEISETRSDVLRIIRVKNRLDQKDSDILINVFLMNKLQCEFQLSIMLPQVSDMSKAKHYSTYNHFLYQLKRSLFGPVGQFACIMGQHDPKVSHVLQAGISSYLAKQAASFPEKSEKLNLAGKYPKNVQNERYMSTSNIGSKLEKLQIKELSFICRHCGQLRKLNNTQVEKYIVKDEQVDDEVDLKREMTRECRSCFLMKLERMTDQDIVSKLISLLHQQGTAQFRLFSKHLKLWKLSVLPTRFKEEQLYKHIPHEGLFMLKDSKNMTLEYFRTFMDEDYIYLSAKVQGQVVNFVQINRLLKEKDLLAELKSLLQRLFLFYFDQEISIEEAKKPTKQDSESEETDNTKAVAICRKGCCRGQAKISERIEWNEFNETMNRKLIRGILEQNKSIIYLSKRSLGSQLNEIVKQKRLQKACKGINVIEAQDSRLKDIQFVRGMENLSDLYIRYNRYLSSLQCLQNCRHLKILMCNECSISTVRNLNTLLELEELYINENLLEDLNGLENCKALMYFSCFGNKINTLEPLVNCLQLQRLDAGQNTLHSLLPISHLTKLKSLAVGKNPLLTLQGVGELFQLEHIDFSHTSIQDLTLFQKCSKLQKLNCSNTLVDSLKDLNAPLLDLDVGECKMLQRLDLSKTVCRKVEVLIVDNCVKLSNIQMLEQCINLKTLLLQRNQSLEPQQFAFIGRCKKLQELNLNHNTTLRSLQFLQNLPQLVDLSCQNCPRLVNEECASIRYCSVLQSLSLSSNPGLTSFEFLKINLALENLNLSQTGINTLKPLSRLQNLRHLQLRSATSLTIQNFQELKECKTLEKIVISDVLDVKSFKGLELFLQLKELYLGKILKYPNETGEEKERRFSNQLNKLPVKVQRAVKFETDTLFDLRE